jgi:hypothetical protein
MIQKSRHVRTDDGASKLSAQPSVPSTSEVEAKEKMQFSKNLSGLLCRRIRPVH